MKHWTKSIEAGNHPTYHLTKDSNPEWFAKVFAHDGKYTFTIGKRVTQNERTPPRYHWKGKGWKSASAAKTKALEQMRMINNALTDFDLI